MEKTKKRLSALVMAVVLLAALACGGVAAWATGGFPDGEPSDNKLTISAAPADNVEFLADLNGNVQVDVYQIATAEKNTNYVMYDYTATGDFSSLELGNPSQWSAESSKKLAEDAAKLVTADTPKAVSNGAVNGATEFSLAADGLYLVFPHGAGVTPAYGEGVLDSLVARGAVRADGATQYDYLFSPSLVAVPNTDSGTTDGSWTRNAAITLKPEQKPVLGSLEIIKHVQNTGGYPVSHASFGFLVTGEHPDGQKYNNGVGNYINIDYTGGDPEPYIIRNLPAGMVMTVTEVAYNEDTWKPVDVTPKKTMTVKADVQGEVITEPIEFTNEYVPTKGYAFENKFELQKTGEGENDWDWTWIKVTPESVQTEPTN